MTKLIIQLDPKYKSLIKELKTRVRSVQLSATLALNQEQIKLYWELGSIISSTRTRESKMKYSSKD